MSNALFRITSEDDAWLLIERWLNGESIQAIEFKGWPHQKITVKGKPYSSSLRSGQMEALIDFQMSMGRAYAAIAHGSYDKRRLKREEEEKLEFSTSVRKGSSILETDLTPLVEALSKLVINNPIESLIAGTDVSLALISRPMVLKHFENKAKQMESEERSKLADLIDKLTSEDQRRANLFDRAIEKLTKPFPAIPQIVPDVARSYWRFAAASNDADSMEVANTVLSKESLGILSERRANRPYVKKIVEDIFNVEGIVKVSNRYRVQLKSKSYHISVTYSDKSQTGKNISRLMKAMASSQAIRAEVEIKKIDRSIVTGRLLSFSVIEQQIEN